MLKPKKILVPTDFSEYSDKAVERALDIAKQNDAEVIVLHVIEQDIQACTVDYCLSEDEVTKIEKRMIEGAKNRLQQEQIKFSGKRSKDFGRDSSGDSLRRNPEISGAKRC